MRIGEREVVCERAGAEFTIADIDAVVLVLGVRTDETLLGELTGIGCEVVRVGDANGVKNGHLGIREGFEAALGSRRRTRNRWRLAAGRSRAGRPAYLCWYHTEEN